MRRLGLTSRCRRGAPARAARAPRALGILLAVVWLVHMAGAAHADESRDRSRAAFRRGVLLVKQGDYRGARDAFEQAYKLFAHPSILLNLGIARAKTGEYVAAEDDLARFLSDDGGASREEVASARQALGEVRTHLGTLKIKVAPDGALATLDGRPIALVPGALAEVRTTVGAHDLHLEAEGYQATDERVVITHEKDAVRQVALFAAARTPPDRPGAPAAAPSESNERAIVGWTLVGVGGVGLAVGTFAGLRAASLASTYNHETPRDPADRRTGMMFRTLADVAFGLGIISAGIGGYLLWMAPPPSQTSVGLVIGPSFGGVRGGF